MSDPQYQVDWKKPLILAILLTVVSSGVIYLEFSRRPEMEKQEELSKLVYQIEDQQIDQIRLVSGAKSYVFRCTSTNKEQCKKGGNGDWEILQPKKLSADKSNVNSLISLLANLRSTLTLDLRSDSPEKRDELFQSYGLGKDKISSPTQPQIEVLFKDGKKITAFLGEKHPLHNGFFVAVSKDGKLDQERAMVVPASFKNQFDRKLSHWRNKKLFSLAAHEIAEFELKTRSGSVRGQKEDGKWTLRTKNQTLEGDIENIDNVLSAAVFLTAQDFASEDLSSQGGKTLLKKSKKRITLTLFKKVPGDQKEKVKVKPIDLTLYETAHPTKKGQSIAYATVSDRDPIYELAHTSIARLDKGIKELRRQKLITSMERFNVNRLRFSGKPVGLPPIVLTKEGANWIWENHKNETIDNQKVNDLVAKLGGKKVSEFLPRIPSGQDQGIVLTLGDDQTPEKRKIAFWKSKDKLFARDLLTKQKEAMVIDPSLSKALPWSRAFFKKGIQANPKSKSNPPSKKKG